MEYHSDALCFSIWSIYGMILPVLILLTFLPSFRVLAYSAYIGSVFLVLAMVVRREGGRERGREGGGGEACSAFPPPYFPSHGPPFPPSLPASTSPPQVVYVFGAIRHHVFCAVYRDEVKYVPSEWQGIALWFGVTAFLFCVHSMVGGGREGGEGGGRGEGGGGRGEGGGREGYYETGLKVLSILIQYVGVHTLLCDVW